MKTSPALQPFSLISRECGRCARTLRVKGDDIGTGFGEVRDDTVHRLDHQVHIDFCLGNRTNGRTHQRTNGQVGYVMVVHHVEVDNIRAGGDDIDDFFTELGELAERMLGAILYMATPLTSLN